MSGELVLPDKKPLTVVKNRLRIAEFVHPDEPCYFLLETDLRTSDWRSMRRFQMFVVRRNGQLAYFYRDLGPATGEDPFQLLSVWEDTVGQAIDLALYMHEHADMWNGVREEATAHSATLITRFAEQLEQAHKILKHQTHLGPTVISQR